MLSKGKAFSILLGILICFAFINPDDDTFKCDQIQIKVLTKAVNPELSWGEVIIIVKNAKAPITYLFYDKSQKSLSKNIRSNRIENLQEGTYYATIIDDTGCLKTVEYTIQEQK